MMSLKTGQRLILAACLLSLVPLLAPFTATVGQLLAGELPGFLANKDFANYWIAARLVFARDVADLFSSHDVYFRHMQAAFGADYEWHMWSYPPHYLLFVWPLGFLSYIPAMAVFLGATLALYLLAARAFIGRLDGSVLAILLPFAIFNLWAAQNGFLTGALMLGALAWRYERPLLAGILAGCLTVKPQLGVLLPVLYLIEGRWLTILSAAATTLALVAISILWFGLESWQGFIAHTVPYQSGQMTGAEGVFLGMMPSVFGSLRSLGAGADVALAAHAAVALPVLLTATAAFIAAKNAHLRAMLLIAATFLVTPYGFVYDLGAFSALLAVLAVAGRSMLPQRGGPEIVVLAAGLPLFILVLDLISMPVAPLVIGAVFALLAQQAFKPGMILSPSSASG